MRTRASLPSPPFACGTARLAGTATASAVLLATCFLGPTAAIAASMTSAPAVTLTGSVPALPAGSGVIYAEVQLPLDLNSQGVPQRLDDDTVASKSITSPQFSLPVPDSATLEQAERSGEGIVNVEIIVVSGDSITAWGLPVPITAAPGGLNAAQLSAEDTHVVHVPALPAFHAAQKAQLSQAPGGSAGPNPPWCVWIADGSQHDRPTRIGEVHVANTGGVTDTYEYGWQNDETVSWGVSASPDSNWSEGGTGSVTNTLGAHGGHTFGRGTDTYVYTQGYYQEYQGIGGNGGCAGYASAYKVVQVGTAGNVDSEPGKPAGTPYKGGCINDPLNFPLQSDSVWDYDHGQAETYGGAASFAGFSFTASDGFTSDVQHDYQTSENAATTWICGTPGKQPSNTPIVYDTTG